MKKLFSAILFAVAVFGCSGPAKETPTREETINERIKAHLLATLDDPKSYEPVAFDSLRTISLADSLNLQIAPIEETIKSKKAIIADYYDMLIRYADMRQTAGVIEQTAGLKADIEKLNTKIKGFRAQQDSLRQAALLPENKSKVLGYYRAHTFRAKNKMNATGLNKMEFILDTTYKVVGVSPLDAQ